MRPSPPVEKIGAWLIVAWYRFKKMVEETPVMSDLTIALQGYPENVQRVADAIEAAFPGLKTWVIRNCLTKSFVADLCDGRY